MNEVIDGHKVGETNGAILALGYDESGSQPEVKEFGWTGGAHELGGSGCLIPRPGGQAFFVGGFKETGGGGKEGVVAFTAFSHGTEKIAEAIQFGPGGSTSGCPRVTLDPNERDRERRRRHATGAGRIRDVLLHASSRQRRERRMEVRKHHDAQNGNGVWRIRVRSPQLVARFQRRRQVQGDRDRPQRQSCDASELKATPLEGGRELIVKVVGPGI